MAQSFPALSFWQPYAWFIVNGHADVDSRLWSPPQHRIGETFAIHASQRKVTKAEFAEFLETVRHLKIKSHPETREDFDYGAIVGTAKLVKITKNSKSYFAHRGYFHWHLADARTVAPIKTKGQRGWFQVQLELQE